jgi:DNA primase
MNLLDLIPGLKRTATTHGGEWAGPCPFCGGRDRFRAWPNQGATGRYWCRACHKHGDGIQLLRERDGLSYRDACATLEVNPSPSNFGTKNGTRNGNAWEPRPATTPGKAWTNRAGAFLGVCQRNLAGPSGAAGRSFLIGRGLKPETIEAGGLGWNPADIWESRESWGLPPEAKEDGRPRWVWLPAGLVIPCFAGGRLVRLRVRRPEPGDGPRYVIIPGSGMAPLTLGTGTVWVIVESELDAILLWQEAGDVCGVLSMGNAQTRPDAETHQTLRAAGLILVALDTDQAGAREAWQWWTRQYKNVKRWPVPIGKDPSEAKQAGLDLRAWVMAGLPLPQKSAEPITTTEAAPSAPTPRLGPLQSTQTEKTYKDQGSERRTVFEPFPAEWKTRFNEGELERLAIMTVCGGLTDLEALGVIGQC